ncbi:MAG TPA: HNH endonuclease family protein [Candidatus Saccharimonadales bacterium]|nr:HNH endonuclease family protein [Candidatus Saccharimonadales bacterium]
MQALIDIDMTISYPLLLRFFDAYSRQAFSDTELLAGLRTVESYLVRRVLCGLPSNALSRIFIQLAKHFQEVNTADWLKNSLSAESGARRWPANEEVGQAILHQSQYGRKATRYVLLAIERSFGHKEPIDIKKAAITIEHVLPQALNDEWRMALNPNAEEIHGRWLDTLGNLTLTGYNYELGNMPFTEKRKLFQESHLDLNRWIGAKSDWDGKSINERAELLTDKALTLWLSPNKEDETSRDIEITDGHQATDIQTGGWDPNSAIHDIYRRLSDGQWHSLAELVQVVAGRANCEDRLSRIRRRGRNRNLWAVEEEDGRFRLTFIKNPSD